VWAPESFEGLDMTTVTSVGGVSNQHYSAHEERTPVQALAAEDAALTSLCDFPSFEQNDRGL
jgi:hypothetical protein